MKLSDVEYYTTAQAVVTINFPEEQISCSNCQLFCKYTYAFDRYHCILTGNHLKDPKWCIDRDCPFLPSLTKQGKTTI